MQEFKGKGHAWRVEALYERDYESTSSQSEPVGNRKEFEDFWGAQYEWSSMLPIAWKLTTSTQLRVKPSRADSARDPGWWFTPLHLLGLGLGWTDIGKGLYEWERQGFPRNHRVLDFVFNTWGHSLTALQYWLRGSHMATEIEDSLSDLRDRRVETHRLAPLPYDDIEAAFSSATARLEQAGVAARPLALANKLLFGGSDPYHLSGHFAASVWPDDERDEYEADAYALNPDEYIYVAKLDKYAGFHVHLNMLAAGLINGEVFNGKETIQVYLNEFGYLGTFKRHEQTRRWYLIEEARDGYSTDEVHLWGN